VGERPGTDAIGEGEPGERGTTPAMPTQETTADLVTLAMERHESALIRYAASILGDAERAREVVQDTFLKLCSATPEKIRGHLAQWLFTVCRNRAFDVRQKDGRMSPLTEIDLETRPQPGPRPLAALEQQEQLERVMDLVSRLPEKEREVLTLKFQCDLSYREISEVTDLSVSHVGVLIHKGVRRIREQVQSQTSSPAPSLVRRLS
jgi:RNA polymerase sigma-70 factor (ECF subfamily)